MQCYSLGSKYLKMLIKSIEFVDKFKEFKHQIFKITKLINFSVENINPIYLFLIHLIILLPFISIIFNTDGIFPPAITNVLRIFLFTNIASTFAIDFRIMTIAILIFSLTIIILTIIHFIFVNVFTFCSRMLSLFIKLSQYLIVPIANYTVFCYKTFQDSTADSGTRALSFLTFVMTFLSLIIVAVHIKFEIKIIRKKNTLWNLNNDLHVYSFMFMIFKTYFISFNGTQISICFLSLVVWYYHNQLAGGCVNATERLIQRSTNKYIAMTDLAAIFSLISKNQFLGLNVWIFGISSLAIYIAVQIYVANKRKMFIPPCNSDPSEFYNFYYSFKEEFKSDDFSLSNKDSKSIFHLHKIHCNKEICQVNPNNFNEGEDNVERQITQLISNCKQQNIHNRIVHQLWNLELGKKCDVERLSEKPLTLKQDFIVYCINKMTKDSQVTIKSSQSNKNVISKIFYDLIYEISSNYSVFYEELARTHPKIDNIVRLGILIKKKVEKLKEVYSELLKSKVINFKMIELYLQFFTNFVNENVLDKQTVNRLMKVQQNMHFEEISQSFLPTFTLYPDSGNVQNANSQAQKFLQSTRFQLKYRNVTDLLYPSVTISDLYKSIKKTESDNDGEQMHTFFKKAQNQYSYGKIKVSERFIKQKKLIIVQVIKQSYSTMKNIFYVSSEFKMQLMLYKDCKIKAGTFRKCPIDIQWSKLFDDYIVENKQKLIKTKMVKIHTNYKGCILIVKKLNCFAEKEHLLLAQIIITNESSKPHKQSLLHNKKYQNKKKEHQFEFQYVQDEADQIKIVINGFKSDYNFQKKIKSKNRTLELFEKQQQQKLSSRRLGYTSQFGGDIKTYRLFDGELYNIDLEDKLAYNDLFEEHISQSKRKEVNEQSSLQCYIFLAVILLGIGLISISIALILQFQTDQAVVESLYTRFQNIEMFNTDFQRILSLLRDQSPSDSSHISSTFPNYNINNELNQSYSRIQTLKNESLFDNTQYSMQFQNLTMIGTLAELVDVILAHLTEIMYSFDANTLQDIHNSCFNQLNDLIDSNQGNILDSINKSLDQILLLKNILLYSSIVIVLVLYFFMILYCIKSNYKAKSKLADLMYISDTEARTLQENAEKMKYAVEMARKNFDIDTQNLLISSTDFKRRKNPKEAILSRQIVYTIGIITVLGILIHITCLILFSQQFSAKIGNFKTIQQQGLAITSVYHQTSELVTQIVQKKQLDPLKLSIIRQSLNTIEYSMNSMLFTSDFSQFIIKLFFQNSCDQLNSNYNISQALCTNMTPRFTIVNPFQIGFAPYLHRQIYYISNNITENFGFTGVLSRPFATIFTNITAKVKIQGITYLQNTLSLVSLLNVFVILIDCSYILTFVIIYRYFKNQFVKIKEILFFFNNKLKANKSVKQKSESEHNMMEQLDDRSQIDALLRLNTGEQALKRKRKPTIEDNVNNQQ